MFYKVWTEIIWDPESEAEYNHILSFQEMPKDDQKFQSYII